MENERIKDMFEHFNFFVISWFYFQIHSLIMESKDNQNIAGDVKSQNSTAKTKKYDPSKRAERYQKSKEKIAEQYQKNKEKIAEKYQAQKSNIALKKSKKYQEQKLEISEKRMMSYDPQKRAKRYQKDKLKKFSEAKCEKSRFN
jgi:ATP-dependent exoDNAse (exonuclease V) beta subunit